MKHFILLRDLLIRKWSKSFFGLDAQPSIQIYWAILKHFNRTEYHLYYLCCENDITAANLFLYLTFSLLLPCTYSQNKGCYISWVTSGTEQKGNNGSNAFTIVHQNTFRRVTFTFSEISNYWQESLLEVIRQNIAG